MLPQRKKKQTQDLVTNAIVVHPLRVPFCGLKPVCDYTSISTSISTTIQNYFPLDALLGSTGVLQAYPQHATPVYMAGVYRLRTRILIRRIEFRFVIAGAVSNAVVQADLYNTFRVAFHLSGTDYTDLGTDYLTSVAGGTNLTDVKRIYFDKTFSLPSQAYDTTITTPTPQIRNWEGFFEPNLMLDCFSTTATGAGAPWNTNGLDLDLEAVSDSSLAPHPFFQGNVRLIFEYI